MNILIKIALLLLFLPLTAFSQENPDNKIYTAAYETKYACKTGEAAYSVERHETAATEFIRSGHCFRLPSTARFKVIDTAHVDEVYFSQIKIVGAPEADPPLYVSGGLTIAYQECRKGDVGPGGQVNRLERSKTGQVYMKQYMITSKCVDGQMHSFTTPIN